MNVRRCHVDVRGEFMLNVSIHSDASPPSPSYLCPRCQSVHFSFLCLRLMSDMESSTLKWRTGSPFPKVKMRYGLRIPIATDQMNGGGFIYLTQSVGLALALGAKTQREDHGLRDPSSYPSGCRGNIYTHILDSYFPILELLF